MPLVIQCYALRDPRTGSARYVGRSWSPSHRLKQHCSKAAAPQIKEWVDELRSLGLAPILEVLEGDSEGEWISRLSPDLNAQGKRGGSRADAGHPITTGMSSTPVVSFRLSVEDYRALAGLASQMDKTPNQAAKAALLGILNRTS